jgi:tetratricopeptide (TPR) repeat protein
LAIPGDEARTALAELKSNNINTAIKALITLSNNQLNLQESAKTWINIGNIQNLTSTKQALLAYKKASDYDSSNSNAWSRQGDIYRQLKQFDNAEIAYKKVQALGNQDIANEAFSLANFGLLNQSKGDLVAAEKAFSQALDIYSKIENDAGIASTSEYLASLYTNSEQFDKAEKFYLKALKIHQSLEHPQNIATAHSALGSLYQTMKLSNKAQTHYEKALEINLNNNFKGNIASLYSNLGILAQQNGKEEKSKEYFEKSLEHNKDIKRSNSTANQYGNLAILNRKQKNYEKAESYHRQAIEIYKYNKHMAGVVSQQINLGFLYKVWQKNDQACNIWRDSLIILKRTSSDRTNRVEQLLKSSCQ